MKDLDTAIDNIPTLSNTVTLTHLALTPSPMQAVINLNNISYVTIPVTQETTGDYLYHLISTTYGLSPSEYYITDVLSRKRVVCSSEYKPWDNCSESDQFLDVKLRLLGGGIMKRIFKSIFKAIFAVFSPIIKPLQAIANAFLLLIKAIIYIIALAIWLLKVMVWFFVQFLPSLPLDFILLIKQLTTLIFSTIIQTLSQILKRIVNFFGQMTVYSLSAGWDNARDSTATSDNPSGKHPEACTQHCYRAPDGSIPLSLVAVTVLCPPVGVFMEFGMHGWLKILVCFILTLMMYFPGLIYALILLYC